MIVSELILFLSQKTDLLKLRKNPLFAIALLKILNDKTKELLFSLLTANMSIKMLNTGDEKRNKQIIANLRTLHLLKIIKREQSRIVLEEDFRDGFIASMQLIEIQNCFTEVEYAKKENATSFDNILRMLVNDNNIQASGVVLDVLKYSQLVNLNKEITHSGFEFLLKSKKEQMWFMILNGILMLGKKYVNWLTMLVLEMGMYRRHFWLKINTNRIYGIGHESNSSDAKREMRIVLTNFLNYLTLLGIISLDGSMIKPTPDYFALFSSVATKESFLIVETNYKLYAYTTSPHEISIIKLFCIIIKQLPNMVVGHITEESINSALDKGITGQQIVDYLTEKSKCELPFVVFEQILIWERKKDRIKHVDAVIYSHFLTYNEYETTYKFCKGRNMLIDHDENRRVLIVKLEHHNDVKSFIRNNLK